MSAHDQPPVTELDLLAYVDGQLDPERLAFVEAWLADNPEEMARVQADLVIADGLRRLFERGFDPAPDSLTDMLDGKPRRRVRPLWIKRIAAALTLVAAGAAGGWLLADPPVLSSAGVPDTVVPARSAAAPSQELLAWVPADAPDLSRFGFRLVGQDLLSSSRRPTVRFTYSGPDNRRVELFVQARFEGEEPYVRYDRMGRQGMLWWPEGPIVYALSGTLPDDQLHTLAIAVQADEANRVPRQAPQNGVVTVSGSKKN